MTAVPRVLLLLVALAGCTKVAPSSSQEMAMPAAPSRVVVVGGGLAGLVTAYELQKRGISSTVLEASDTWGGRVATAYYGEGLAAEYGMQEIWQGNPLNDIAKELAVAFDPGSDEAYSSLEIDGKLVVYGHRSADAFFRSFLSAPERAALASWLKQAKALRDQAEREGLKSPAVRELQELSFADWVKKSRLPHKVSEWIRLTIECELASEWEGFSALVGLIEIDFILDGGLPSRHVAGGNSKIIDALVGALRSPKLLSAVVVGIEREQRADGKLAVRVSYRKNRRVETIAAERVVVAVPFMQLHQIDIVPPLAPGRWDAINTLGRGQYAVVHLLVDKQIEALLPASPSPFPILTDGALGVIYGVQEESPATQPLEVFSLLVYGARAQSFHMVPREQKIQEITAELERRWPGFAAQVRKTFVYTYHPAALPVWPPGRSPLDDKDELLQKPDAGLYLAGDYAGGGAHSSAAVESALRVAAQIAAELTR
jgi:monoamine oxidase